MKLFAPRQFTILLCWLLRFDIKIISVLKGHPKTLRPTINLLEMLKIVGTSLENFE